MDLGSDIGKLLKRLESVDLTKIMNVVSMLDELKSGKRGKSGEEGDASHGASPSGQQPDEQDLWEQTGGGDQTEAAGEAGQSRPNTGGGGDAGVDVEKEKHSQGKCFIDSLIRTETIEL